MLLVALLFDPHGNTDFVVDRCELIEHNEILSDEGVPRFRQWIFWEWNWSQSRYHVKAWKVANGELCERTADGWRLRIRDRQANCFREIHATSYQRSSTWFDPEMEDRTDWPHRSELTKPPARKAILP